MILQSFSVMVRYIPITLHQANDGIHTDLATKITAYVESIERGWEVLDVSVHATVGYPVCTAFLTFSQATHAHDFIASHRAKYQQGWVRARAQSKSFNDFRFKTTRFMLRKC